MKKTLAIKFTRNPKFTPASLTAEELARCERIAKAYFIKNSFKLALDKGDGEQCLNWLYNGWRNGATNLHQWLGNNARWTYTKTCINYLIAVGLNNGEITPARRDDPKAWAAKSFGYGY